MPDPAQRRARLLDLLPRVYAAQPRGSAVGTLLDVMAQHLADFDQDLQRVLHDRWVALACGVPDALDDDVVLDRQITRPPARIRHARFERRPDHSLVVDFVSREQRGEALRLLGLQADDGSRVALPRIAGLKVDLDGSVRLVFTGTADLPAGTAAPLDRLLELLVPEPTPVGDAALDRLGALLQIARLPARIRHARFEHQTDGRLGVDFVSREQRDEALRLLELQAADGERTALPRIAGLTVALDGPARLVFTGAADLPAGTAAPLDRLLELLMPEPTEAYRQRLQITVAVTGQGLVTPRSLLSLAIADLGAAPCPKFRREHDATLARAVAQRAPKRCGACADPKLPCPQAALFEAWITEQPAQPAAWQANDAQLQHVLRLRNDSLVSDRPELTMAVDRPVSFPALQSRASGEIMLYADDLMPGHTLRLLPQLTPAEAAATLSYDRPVGHQWLLRSPRGRAELVEAASGRVRDVSASVFYLRGNRFDDAASKLGGVNVDGLRCGVLEQVVRTPLLEPGENDWILLTFAAPAYRFDAKTTVLARGPNDPGAHFALLDAGIGDAGATFAAQLFQLLKRTDDAGVDPATLPHFKLAAHWLARPPFLFNLRIPKNGWVQAAELRGAVDLLRIDIERARPAGVRARVDFPEPVYREQQTHQEALAGFTAAAAWAEDAAPGEAAGDTLARSLALALSEPHRLGEGGLTMGAIIDITRFDWSTLQ